VESARHRGAELRPHRIERAWCEAKPSYYGNDCELVTADPEKPASLDLELKVLENGRFVCKQVREFGGR
jgi:hypothetical protein